MSNEQEAGGLKQVVNKVTDAVGGMVGQASAASTRTADQFVENAAIGDRYEIRAGMIALQRAQRDDVRLAARQMIIDHTTSTHQLQAALEMNETAGVIAPPLELDNRRQGMIQHLMEASDDGFDKQYLDQQVLAHEETVTLMRNFAEGGDNSQLRSFALSTAPVVERHLEHMKHLRELA
ncbi:DUF4142 domain-containing protein [Sphingobium agri]|uniref:DUF4142 domain-containing protein n=2 Tax=Sphingobium TaxID=165695 RepID=A0ABT0E0S0_9SPHN|nr:DUF4142 domain-containing protein [Sphingobium agri]MCK0532967.1 DUF4142 domain-containing protein [Sphingobium agri]